jgi:hypothetical protein
MAQHSVFVRQMPEVEIQNKDMIIHVEADGVSLGRLTISRGGVGWFSNRDQLERPFTWEQFDRCILQHFGEK